MIGAKRLIDATKAQAVLLNIAGHLMEAGNPEMAGAVGYAAEVIGKQKTVDAVEVVWCRNCKNNERCSVQDAMNYTPRTEIGGRFCSYGERRNDDQKEE